MAMRLMIMGPPGVGKGTQAELIKITYDLYHLSTGDILRDAVQQNSELGHKVKDHLDAGELVPDKIVGEIIEEKLKENQVKEKFLLDGFPRTEKQVEILDDVLERLQVNIGVAFFINVDEEEIIWRLSGRRVCSHCGTLYHVKNKPPKKEEYCDKCHGKLIQRKDDTEEVIRERLAIYKKQTLPVIEIYKKRGILIEINGSGGVKEVFKRICDHLPGA